MGILVAGVLPGCGPNDSPTESFPRNGVVDIPVEAAPAELWAAAQVWNIPSATVSLVVQSLNDGTRTATYFLDIGLEEENSEGTRDEFRRRLGALGWKEESERGGDSSTYSSNGRRLEIGFHPMFATSLIVKYVKLSGQAEDSPEKE